MNKKMDMNIVIFYLTFSIFCSIITYLLPLYYINMGFSEVQIGVLTSIFSLAAIFSPVFGYLAENKYSTKIIWYISSIIVLFSLFFLLFSQHYFGVLILVTLYAIFQSPMFGLGDMYVTSYTEKYELNYGKFKRFAALGWGIGVFFAIPFMIIWGYKGFLISAMLFVLITILMIAKTEEVRKEPGPKTSIKSDVKALLANREYLLVLSVSCLFWGTVRLRLSYQSILMSELSSDSIYIAIMTFFMIVPEIFILPLYPRIRSKFSFAHQMYFVMVIMTIMLLIFSFSTNPMIVAFSSGFHGVMAAIYFPAIIFAIRKCVPGNLMVTAMLVMGSVLSVWTFLVSLLVVTPVYANFGVEYVFFAVMCISFFTLIPLFFLRKLRI